MVDKGHDNLINDLKLLYTEAIDFEFHDFKNTRYATPKIELHKKLLALINNNRDGKYDNE